MGGDGAIPEDRAREALEHLQSAALELIAAARAVLDVAEELVTDPGAAAELVTKVSEAAEHAGFGRRGAPGPGSSGSERVQRIQVS